MKSKILGLLAAGLLIGPMAAHATLTGSTVTSQYYAFGGTYNLYGSPTTFVANGTVQQTFCAVCGQGFDLQVTGNQIIYTLLFNGAWSGSGTSLNQGGLFIENGNLLTFFGVTLNGVTVDAATNLTGFNSSYLTFNSQNIALNWAGLGADGAGQQVILNVLTNNVPEPGTLALLGLGLLGLGVTRRKAA